MSGDTAHRQFYDFQDKPGHKPFNSEINAEEERENLFKFVNDNIIGNETIFTSPFGNKKVTYCDYTASGRSLKFIEGYIMEQVLPQYGSTHTTTSVTSLQTSLYRHEARDIIRNAVRASEHDRIIFTGSGTTGAINKLIHGLMFNASPVVFVDFTAHHSSLLPWREIGALVLRIREDKAGNLDLDHLKILLNRYKSANRQMVGCFSAASNITGVIMKDNAITVLLHKHGALAFWDFATAAPYLDVVMNPHLPDDPSSLAHKDAIFFSLHKFVGGVQTPGVLIAKKNMFQNQVPLDCGGGTVFFVSRDSHRYLKDVEEREEGGTPPIVETIRGGMVMQLKMSLTPSAITARCFRLSRRIGDLVSSVPELVPLGNVSPSCARLPILSFVARHAASGKLLHYNFVSAVLNDVFGVQSRGGCACAGPYAQDLLGIDEALAQRYDRLLREDPSLDRAHLRRKEEHGNMEVLRPGFVRLNLPYTASEEQIDFIFSALRETCANGWKLLPQYIFNPETGEWKHHTNLVFKNRQWLQNISYSKGFFEANLKKTPSGDVPSYAQVLEQSEALFAEAVKVGQRMTLSDQSILFEGEALELSWFLHPFEAQKYLRAPAAAKLESRIPFTPPVYPLDPKVLQSRPEFVWREKEAAHRPNALSDLVLTPSHEETEGGVGVENTKKPSVLVEKGAEQNDTFSTSKLSEELLSCENGMCALRNEEEVENGKVAPKQLSKAHWVVPTKIIFNPAVEALQAFNMIRPDDKVLVCLSGGKDSLSLLHALRQYQFYARSKGTPFSLGAVTVDPGSSSYDPSPLIPYLEGLEVPYFYEEQAILKQAMELGDLNSICSFCSRMKRGRIYAAARREGFNVVALGQHLDDLAESFLMSIFHNGRLRTMKASYTVKEGDLRVIRPFVYVREKELRNFAESSKLPIIPENCPACFESPKERHRVKQVLAQQEVLFPGLFWSLKTCLLPLLAVDKTGLENELFGKRVALIGGKRREGEQEEEED